MLQLLKKFVARKRYRLNCHYRADGLGVRNKKFWLS